jgi:general stress protein 26
MTKLWDTESGVTLWTKSTRRTETVARLRADTSGNINFGASDPKDAYSNLVPNLVYDNTVDFRSRYEYRRVK